MSSGKILWVDDEIQLLKPHMLFLEKKNYEVTPCTNGADAVEIVSEEQFDIIFLDENMPGLSGLETLTLIKEKLPNLPVIMITKSEEEYIMEEAIGSKIADYLIKPINPNQILLSLKKNLDNSRLVSEKTTSNYQQEFRKISLDLAMVNTPGLDRIIQKTGPLGNSTRVYFRYWDDRDSGEPERRSQFSIL